MVLKEIRVQSQRLAGWVETTMPCPLPPEILDLIVDHLHDEPFALRAQLEICCLVSKSWVPRTRKHLFTHLTFDDSLVERSKSHIELWKRAFPDPFSKTWRCLTFTTTAVRPMDGTPLRRHLNSPGSST